MQKRSVGCEEEFGCLLNVLGVTSGTVRTGRCVLDVLDLGRRDIARQLEQHGSAAAVPELREGAPHQFGNAVGEVDAADPLADVAVDRQWVEFGRLAEAV